MSSIVAASTETRPSSPRCRLIRSRVAPTLSMVGRRPRLSDGAGACFRLVAFSNHSFDGGFL
jgi:hypothetical protein